MRRSVSLAVPLAIAALAVPSWAVAQPTATAPPAAEPAATTPAATAPPYTGPPKIWGLRLRTVVTAQQGHARFMLGFTSAGPATFVITISSKKGKALTVVRTITSAADEPGGKVWNLVQAVNDQGYQLPSGIYNAKVTATDAQGRVAKPLTKNFRLTLTPPRARIDCYTVPNLAQIARQMRIPPGGQLVTALGPKGVCVTAGLRRGDVITKINNLDVTNAGAWRAALMALPADTDMPIEYRRGAEARVGTVKFPPDWNPAPAYDKAFPVLLKRTPGMLGYMLAAGRDRIDAGKPKDAQTLFEGWATGLATTGVGQMHQAEILLAEDDLKGALGAYNRAVAKAPTLAPALVGRGLVLSRLERHEEAVIAFQAAVQADPADAIAQAFLAYALIRIDQFEPAVAAASDAIRLDPTYADGYIALGLALIGLDQKPKGVGQLKKGLLLMSDDARAATIISESLEPNDNS